MESCKYQEVNTNSNAAAGVRKTKWITVLRQMFMCSGVWSNNFLYGLSLGSPVVIIPLVRQEANSTEAITEEMASWLSSGFGISGIIWLVPLSILVAKFGRRKSFIIIAVNSLVGFTVLYFSKTVLQILIGLLIHGAARSCMYILSPIIVTEYSSPRHRGLFSTLDSASFFWGIWVANAIGTFAHWKNIAILGTLCPVYAMSAIFWPESPHWLASKGRFDECAEAYRWLRGSGNRSEKELLSLITSQIHELEKSKIPKSIDGKSFFRSILISVKDRTFYKPLFLSVTLVLLFDFSGKTMNIYMDNQCIHYALVIIQKITNSPDVAYTGMLTLDGLNVFCAYAGCGLAKLFKRRTLLFAASSISIIFMLLISLQLYLIKLKLISESTTLSLFLLSGYTLAIGCGPMILIGAIISELMPLKFRSILYLLVSLMGQSSITILLKMSLPIFKALEMHGTFLFYALPSMVILGLLYKYLPETGHKTM